MTTVILGAQSNVWTQLTLPNPPSGSVPFVWTDNASISVAPLDFNFDIDTSVLKIANGIKVKYSDVTATPSVTPVVNQIAGRFKVPAGQSVVNITNSMASVGDIVAVNIETSDATLTRAVAIVTVNGNIQVSGNNAATGTPVLTFQLTKVY